MVDYGWASCWASFLLMTLEVFLLTNNSSHSSALLSHGTSP